MTASDTLSLWGIQRPVEVVELAAAAGLSLAAAAALLEQESRGGRNVFGHDRVATGGAYSYGDDVTEAKYRAYRRALGGGTAGQQGVGPCQLTGSDFQDQADRLGGCWLPRCSTTVGFALLAGYVRRWDLPRAYRAYNGGPGTVTNPARYPSPPAHVYERQAMDRHARWADRLGARPTPTARPLPTPASPSPSTVLEDDLMGQITIIPDVAGRFQYAVGCEVGGGSQVATKGWVAVGSTYGGTTFTVAALGADGRVLGYWKDQRAQNNSSFTFALVDGTRAVTVEGASDNAGTRPWASTYCIR